MRVFLVLLIVVGLAFLGIIGFADDSEEPPANNQQRADFKPGPRTSFFGRLALLYPGASWILPGPNPFVVGPGGPRTFNIPAAGDDDTRLLRLALVSGAFARVSFDCSGSDCSQSLCLASPPGPVGGCSNDPAETGGLVLDPAGGLLRIDALPFQTATIESR